MEKLRAGKKLWERKKETKSTKKQLTGQKKGKL
jgi:hypothetical protein